MARDDLIDTLEDFDDDVFEWEGPWREQFFTSGPDSTLVAEQKNPVAHYSKKRFELILGEVLIPQPEPVYLVTTVSVDLVRGGLLTNVGWPGPNVEANPAGLPVPGSIGIHGLWESPLPGQQVIVGFIEGDIDNPIVIGKYSYQANQRIEMSVNHFLPMTMKAIGPTDVALGHHTGSFIAIRGTLPIPAEIDIFTLTIYTLTVGAAAIINVIGSYTETVGAAKTVSVGGAYTMNIGAAYTLTIAGIATISAGAAYNITTPLFSINAALTQINSGVRAVAALGDLVPTLLGLSPILATGVVLTVP